MALEKIYTAYRRHNFESSSGLTPDFAAFASGVKKALKKDCENAGIELIKFTRGHFYVSAFVLNPNTNRMVYISIGDVRCGVGGHPLDQILYRSVKYLGDHTGGQNRYASLTSLVERVKELTER